MKGIATKRTTMSMDDWTELDALARSTIKLNLAETIYFTMVNAKTTDDEAMCYI